MKSRLGERGRGRRNAGEDERDESSVGRGLGGVGDLTCVLGGRVEGRCPSRLGRAFGGFGR